MDEIGKIIYLLGACYNAVTPIYHDYREKTEEIISGKITDIDRIEHFLDTLMDFYFDHRFVYLYKRICRYLLPKYPQIISEHVKFFIVCIIPSPYSSIKNFTCSIIICGYFGSRYRQIRL